MSRQSCRMHRICAASLTASKRRGHGSSSRTTTRLTAVTTSSSRAARPTRSAARFPGAWASPVRDPRWKALTTTVGVLGGAALIVLGAVAIARGDLDGSLNLPIVEVAGWPHSPLLGILEIVAGAALAIVSLSSVGELLVSAVIAGFGAIALIEPRCSTTD